MRRPCTDSTETGGSRRADERRVDRPCIAHRSGDWADMVERNRQWHDARRRDFAERRLEADDSACGRGNPNRSAGVGADRRPAQAGRHGCRRASARASWRSADVTGVVNGSECRLVAGRPERQLVQIALPDDDGAGLAQPRHDQRIGIGDVSFAHPRRGCRRRALHVDEIFDGDRAAMQRASRTPLAHFLVQRLGRGHGLGLEDGDERVERWIERRNAFERARGRLLQPSRGAYRLPSLVLRTPCGASRRSRLSRAERYVASQTIRSNGPASLYSIRRGSPPITVARPERPLDRQEPARLVGARRIAFHEDQRAVWCKRRCGR